MIQQVHNVEVRLFDPERNKPRKHKCDPMYSDDVCTIDENNIHGLAFYSFEDEEWMFHTEVLTDYKKVKWMWYYPVVSADDVFKPNKS